MFTGESWPSELGRPPYTSPGELGPHAPCRQFTGNEKTRGLGFLTQVLTKAALKWLTLYLQGYSEGAEGRLWRGCYGAPYTRRNQQERGRQPPNSHFICFHLSIKHIDEQLFFLCWQQEFEDEIRCGLGFQRNRPFSHECSSSFLDLMLGEEDWFNMNSK